MPHSRGTAFGSESFNRAGPRPKNRAQSAMLSQHLESVSRHSPPGNRLRAVFSPRREKQCATSTLHKSVPHTSRSGSNRGHHVPALTATSSVRGGSIDTACAHEGVQGSQSFLLTLKQATRSEHGAPVLLEARTGGRQSSLLAWPQRFPAACSELRDECVWAGDVGMATATCGMSMWYVLATRGPTQELVGTSPRSGFVTQPTQLELFCQLQRALSFILFVLLVFTGSSRQSQSCCPTKAVADPHSGSSRSSTECLRVVHLVAQKNDVLTSSLRNDLPSGFLCRRTRRRKWRHDSPQSIVTDAFLSLVAHFSTGGHSVISHAIGILQ